MFCSIVGKRIELILFPWTYLDIYDRRLDFIVVLQHYFGHLTLVVYRYFLVVMDLRVKDFENNGIKSGKTFSRHPPTGRFNTVILFGHECAWSPDNEFKGFEDIRL